MNKIIVLAFIGSWSILQASQKEIPSQSVQDIYRHHLEQSKKNSNDYHKNSLINLERQYPALKQLKISPTHHPNK